MSFVRRALFGLFETQESISEQDVRRGSRLLMVDAAGAMGMATLTGGPFLAAFAIAMGASNYEVGLIATIGFASQFVQIPGLYLVKRFPRRRGITVLAAGAARLTWVFIILIPLIFMNRGVTFLLQWLFVAALIGAIPGPAWNSLFRDIVPPSVLGRVASGRMMLGTVLGLGLTIAGGYFIDWWKAGFPDQALYAYSILFGAGLLFGLAGVYAIARLPEPTMKVEEGVSVVDLLLKPVRNANFRKLLSFVMTWNFAVNLAGPFFMIYLMKRLEMSLFVITVLTVTSQLTNILFLRIWGKLADRFSNKSVLALSGPLFLIAVLGWTFTTMPEKHFLTLPLLFGIHVLSGMSLAGVSIGSANIALKLSPPGQAHSYMTAYGIAGAITGAVAPILGGVFADIFASRGLAISLSWTEPTQELSIYALNIRALDFLFAIAFIIGLFSLRRLARVHEEGEVGQANVRGELLAEVAAPFRIISTIPGVRHIVAIPVSAVYRLASGLRTEPEDGAKRPESRWDSQDGATEKPDG